MEKDSKSSVLFIALLIVFLVTSGYLYNTAQHQARDIRACEQAGAKWRYSSFTNQVFCVPKQPQCKEYFKDER